MIWVELGAYEILIGGDAIYKARLKNGQPWPRYEDGCFSPLEHALAKELFSLKSKEASDELLEAIAKDASERVHKNSGCVPQLAYAPILFALQDGFSNHKGPQS